MILKFANLGILAAALFLIAGCEKTDPLIQGKLTNDGQALQVSEKGDIQVEFVQDGTGQSYLASVKPDGSYELTVPPGDYKVAIQQLDPYPNVDKLKGKFSQKKTPIKKKLEGGETFDIELSEYAK
ncbi:hypothetical protein DTL42_24810 [Bremerella cremea]|uniref:Carboxypeptidase regulatory-like domain-containing protein n=1 Tax=Bremerella cremea TaxID=1031537 RepID=A0A368KMN0_9BACT|nr:DUF3823 domain-containing protein [Bremerella cremea]RCS40595.1 hypothetical protein DTL42_24810 [Bremerella cremea]